MKKYSGFSSGCKSTHADSISVHYGKVIEILFISFDKGANLIGVVLCVTASCRVWRIWGWSCISMTSNWIRSVVALSSVITGAMFLSTTVQADEPVDGAGDFLRYALPAAALSDTLLHKDPKGFGQFCKSGLTCLAVTEGLKLSIDEVRPNGHSHASFPSGHTSASFFGASFIQRRYGWEYGVPAYVAASYVGWSRVEKKAHYVHDVVAGAAIGVVSTYLFTTPLTEDIEVAPFVSSDSIGVSLSFKF